MKLRRIMPVVAFGAVLGIHAVWHLHARGAGPWVSFTPDEAEATYSYFGSGEMWLGLSYATAAAFAAFCLSRFYENRRLAVAGTTGGLALIGFLYAAGCFLLGCCGSPMLVVYLGLFGPRFSGITGPLMFGITLASVAVGYAWPMRTRSRSCACCDPGSGERAVGRRGHAVERMPRWITGWLETPVGSIPAVATVWALRDRLGTLAARLGIGRMRYSVPSRLYGVGSPSAESPVFVTANYKMSFDHLRAALDGRDGWILVLDTNGINVWCAAGKGTFGTEGLVARIAATRLPELVSHRTLILPQLGAPGVAAHDVARRSGFRVTYGPVRAADLPAFLSAAMEATPQMRRVTFGLTQRLALVPMELFPGLKYAAAVSGCMFLLAGIGPGRYSLQGALEHGAAPALLCLLAFLGGAAATPVLLPWLPGRAFSLKGAIVGLAIAVAYVLLQLRSSIGGWAVIPSLAWLLVLPAISSFFAMNFTGSSTYTSLSGVKREMRLAVPAQAAAMVVGLGLWLASRFL